jgi:hypothetical protein
MLIKFKENYKNVIDFVKRLNNNLNDWLILLRINKIQFKNILNWVNF